MLNIVFWMMIISTAAVMFFNKWVIEVQDHKNRLTLAYVSERQAVAAQRSAGQECVPSDFQESIVPIFYELPKVSRIGEPAGLELFQPKEEKCPIYDMSGKRVA